MTSMTEERRSFIRRLQAADVSWNSTILVALAHVAGNEIERLCGMLDEANEKYRTEMDGVAHNRFYDQRDAYFEGIDDERRAGKK